MMLKRILLVAGVAAFTLSSLYWGQSFLIPTDPISSNADRTPEDRGNQRIISLAPSITEILFALGRGDELVGVTRYCNHPPEVRNKSKIGGYFDLNYEAVVELEPTLIIMLEEHVKAREYFKRAGYRTLVVSHRTMENIIESIQIVGEACQSESEAEAMIHSIREEIERISQSVRGRPLKRTMVAVDRSKPRSLEQIYIAGNDGFFDTMIELAGGINVYDGSIPFPAISAEGILQMNPEVIIEIVPETSLKQSSADELLGDWRVLKGVAAVRKDQVFLLTKEYASIPGPRFIFTLHDIVSLLHSEES